MSEYIVKGAEPNETVLHTRTPNGYEEWRWLPVREEIVRCMDCKYYIEDSESCTWFHTLPFGDEVEVMTHPNGFCAWGERKDA